MLIIGLREPAPCDVPPSLTLEADFLEICHCHLYDNGVLQSHCSGHAGGRSILMRRVGVAGGDVCDGSFHREGWTGDSQGRMEDGEGGGHVATQCHSPGLMGGNARRTEKSHQTESATQRGSGARRPRCWYLFFISSVGQRRFKLPGGRVAHMRGWNWPRMS